MAGVCATIDATQPTADVVYTRMYGRQLKHIRTLFSLKRATSIVWSEFTSGCVWGDVDDTEVCAVVMVVRRDVASAIGVGADAIRVSVCT